MIREILGFEKRLLGTYFFFDSIGFWFLHNGDEVGWIYPWKRKDMTKKWISLGFTGTGDFGDACFKHLQDIDRMWDYWEASMEQEWKNIEEENNTQ